MQLLIDFILLSFVCYRLAQLITIERGPFAIFETLRQKTSDIEFVGELLTCPYCLGMWIALPLSLYATGIDWYIAWLAIAGGQAFLQGLSK